MANFPYLDELCTATCIRPSEMVRQASRRAWEGEEGEGGGGEPSSAILSSTSQSVVLGRARRASLTQSPMPPPPPPHANYIVDKLTSLDDGSNICPYMVCDELTEIP